MIGTKLMEQLNYFDNSNFNYVMKMLARTSIISEVNVMNMAAAPLLPSMPGIPPAPPLLLLLLSGVCPSPEGMTSPTGAI